MAIIPLYGHHVLRERLLAKIRLGTLPQSVLLHGQQGVGKQRLALWMAQALLCPAAGTPCGECRHCRYAGELTHPDLIWIFPRPRPKESDPDVDDVATDLAEARQGRAEAHGLYASPSGSEGIFVSTVRHLVQQASKTPALARRKVFVVGDADRMVAQEGADQAANAFLKLLEEPPADTWLILTTSAVGALLPTIRSRVVAIRVPRLDDAAMRAFLDDSNAKQALDALGVPDEVEDRLALAQGAPGLLLSSAVSQEAMDQAKRFLDAATAGNREQVLRLAFAQGHSGARGGFSDVLDALSVELHERLRSYAERPDERRVRAIARAVDLVEDAKRMAEGNVSPQLITARLLGDLSTAGL